MAATLAAVPAGLHRAGEQDVPDPAERLARARAALGRAEAAAGLRTRLSLGTSRTPGAPRDAHDEVPAHDEAPAHDEVSGRGVAEQGEPAPGVPDVVSGSFAVPEVLAPLVPGGALARGSVVQVAGSTSLVLALAAAAARDGAWCALAALPNIGWRAAAGAGLALDRVAVVPVPGPDAASVVGALVDGFDVLVVGRSQALAERDRRLLAARVRTRGAVLLSTHPWPGAHLVLQAARPAWEGLGQGWGHLVGQELTVRATGRAGAARGAEVRVRVGPDGVRPAEAGPVGAVTAAPAAEAPLLRAV